MTTNSRSINDAKIVAQLTTIYGADGAKLLSDIQALMDDFADRLQEQTSRLGWTEQDRILITYGDQVSSGDRPTLEILQEFLQNFSLSDAFSTVHILPFCPYSSDDGFSVIDFRKVDHCLGDWHHLHELSADFELMYDLVLNHVSQRSDWFQEFLQGSERYGQWFHSLPEDTDVSLVTRPRSHPLLTSFATTKGQRHVWTTFSEDQIDLNYACPAVLLEMLDILLSYIANGGRIIRLDAVAFLWKELGTTCLHLEQTHAVIKLMRTVLDTVAPHAILLTETNVPHVENISYFGANDEAHMVYNFSLPPLTYDAYVHEDATYLKRWLAQLAAPEPGTTWLNFLASHDGIGVRPLEGLVSAERVDRLLEATRARGGEVSMRRLPSGDLKPYELNITWCDAVSAPGDSAAQRINRVLGSVAFMLGLQGIPAIYFHILVGSSNDREGFENSKAPRQLNRYKYDYAELCELLDTDNEQRRIFEGVCHLLNLRQSVPAFHPDAQQKVLPIDDAAVVGFERHSIDARQAVKVLANFSSQPKSLTLEHDLLKDLVTGLKLSGKQAHLSPYQVVWLEMLPRT